ncbi:hypothetical protein [Helicobacter fennelliae]
MEIRLLGYFGVFQVKGLVTTALGSSLRLLLENHQNSLKILEFPCAVLVSLGLRALRFCGLSLQALAWQFNKKNSSSQPKESYA